MTPHYHAEWTEPDVCHIWPVTDTVAHDLDDTCVCGPELEINPRPDRPDIHVHTHHPLGGAA